MNLVQINERLKNLPMQVIQQYANGTNPEVPPYLALGELQRRETAQKQMATAQGGMQGPQPSVKEQVEQKAGLMALQQMQQQQMAQQMMQPRGPMPAPANTPQPEAQPEAGMAGGGLASVPVQFDFAGGGIVAFDDGGKVDKYETPYDRMNRENREAAAARDKDPEAAKDSEGIKKALAFVAGLPVEALKTLVSAPGYGLSKDTPPAPRPSQRAPVSEAQATMKAGSQAAVPAGLPAAIAQRAATTGAAAPRSTTPQAVPATAAASAQPDPTSMDAMLRAKMAAPAKERTLEDILAEQKAARTGAGMGEPAGLAQLERIRKMQEQYEGSKPSGLDDLIRVFGQAGQSKGLTGMAPAYTANQAQKRAQDLAMAQKVNELMSGVETTQRGEQKDIATGALSGLGVDRAAAAAREKELMQIMGQGRGQDITAKTAEAQRKTLERGQDLQFKAAMAQVNATLARANMDLTQNQRVALADKAIDNVNSMVKSDMKLGMQLSKNPGLRDELVRRETERLLAAATGAKMPAAPGAASPGGTTLKYNPATGKIE